MDWQTPFEIPFNGNNVLLLRDLRGRKEPVLRALFESHGEVIYFKQIPEADTCIIAFKAELQAQTARYKIEKEHVFFAEEETTEPMLQIPIRPSHQKMTSPPPSPPEGWTPANEDINRIPYVDLQEVPLAEKQNLLLEKTVSAPRIVLSLPE